MIGAREQLMLRFIFRCRACRASITAMKGMEGRADPFSAAAPIRGGTGRSDARPLSGDDRYAERASRAQNRRMRLSCALR